jgi:carboxylesterase
LNRAPFLFSHPEKSPIALLLIHGLAASPWEVLEVGKRAFEKGFNVYGVRLAGHGTTLEDLDRRQYQEWVQSAVEGYELVSHFSDKIILVGESLGGLVSLHLAENQKGEGVVSLAAPLYLKWSNQIFISVFRHFMKFMGRSLPAGIQPYYYPKHSFHALEEMISFSKVVKENLKQIQQPVLLMQSERDLRVDPKSGRVIYEMVGSQVKELITFEKKKNVPHVMTTFENPLLEEVLEKITLFLFRASSQ